MGNWLLIMQNDSLHDAAVLVNPYNDSSDVSLCRGDINNNGLKYVKYVIIKEEGFQYSMTFEFRRMLLDSSEYLYIFKPNRRVMG